MRIAIITLDYDGRSLKVTAASGTDAHHVGLAGFRHSRTCRIVDGLEDTYGADQVHSLLFKAVDLIDAETHGAWTTGAVEPLF